MKTPDEIKKGLERCQLNKELLFVDCSHCPYYMGTAHCDLVLHADTLAYIQQLESRLAQVERERDAALSEWKRTKLDSEGMCWTCKHWLITSTGIHRCVSPDPCDEGENWEWRGVCEENMKDGNEGKA